MMRTESAKKGSFEPVWYIVDAADKPLGRVASRVAVILMGKHKPIYTPHVDTGDYVVVINAGQVKLSGQKSEKKIYYRHSEYIGKLKSKKAGAMLAEKPKEMFELAVAGMLPKSKLGHKMIGKLKVHRGACPAHGYKAQKAQILPL